jgi:hypothetical protein
MAIFSSLYVYGERIGYKSSSAQGYVDSSKSFGNREPSPFLSSIAESNTTGLARLPVLPLAKGGITEESHDESSMRRLAS